MRLGLWRMVPLGASSAHTTCACLATSIPTTQRISGESMAPLLFSSRSLIGRSPGLSPAVPSSIGAHPTTDGAAVRPSTVRTREAGTGGFFGRSSPPIGGPQTVTCQTSRGWLLTHNIRGGHRPALHRATGGQHGDLPGRAGPHRRTALSRPELERRHAPPPFPPRVRALRLSLGVWGARASDGRSVRP